MQAVSTRGHLCLLQCAAPGLTGPGLACIRQKLARLRDLKRVAPSHITEPDTDARVIA